MILVGIFLDASSFWDFLFINLLCLISSFSAHSISAPSTHQYALIRTFFFSLVLHWIHEVNNFLKYFSDYISAFNTSAVSLITHFIESMKNANLFHGALDASLISWSLLSFKKSFLTVMHSNLFWVLFFSEIDFFFF